MKPSFSRLIEAVRGLKLVRARSGSAPAIRLGLHPDTVQPALGELFDALEGVDADGSATTDLDDPARLKEALNATFKWIRMQGLATDEPLALVAEALGTKAEKARKGYQILPAFAPEHVRKKTWKPKLSLVGTEAEPMLTLADHRKNAARMGEVALKIDHIIPTDVPPASPGGP